MTTAETGHVPVLLREILDLFQPKAGDRLLDATLGHGGHAKAYLEATGGKSSVVGIEIDPEALAAAKRNLAAYGDSVRCVNANFWQMKDSLNGGGILPSTNFTHALFDLGIGSHQLADEKRGFSFRSSGSLDMRFGGADVLPPSQLSFVNDLAAYLGRLPDVPDIIGHLSREELATVLRVYGEEKFAGRIAGAIKSAMGQLRTAQDLAAAVKEAAPKGYERGRIHPATRTFQALRLAVNRELEVIEAALPQAVELLDPGGTVAVISFHSLEDRIVKRFFRREASRCLCPPEYPECICQHRPTVKIITKRAIIAGEDEKKANPRAGSAKLRAAQKI